MIQRIAALAFGLGLAASAAGAQPLPPPIPAAAPDPELWWSLRESFPEPEQDPLGGRRWNKRDRDAQRGFNNGVDASLYRLWGLPPLQGLVVRRGDAVFETWFRPTSSTRQAVVRVTLRSDGRTFVQARAGRGCCSPEITRRVDIDQELPGEARAVFRRLKDDALWRQPRHVVVTEGGDVVSSLCVNGASYDITLVDDRRAVHLRRSCDPVEIGSVATAIQAMVGAALGRDPRFDVVFEKEAFDEYAAAYQALRAAGGSVAASDSASEAAASAPDAPASAAEDAVAEIMAADRAFAARAAETTTAAAFREFMDEEGLLFRQDREPIAGREAIFAAFGGAEPSQGRLLWEPAQAWAAASGDLGASWGRSRYVPNDPARPHEAYRYLSVWRRDSEGRWRALMDIGVDAKDLLKAAPPDVRQNIPPAAR